MQAFDKSTRDRLTDGEEYADAWCAVEEVKRRERSKVLSGQNGFGGQRDA